VPARRCHNLSALPHQAQLQGDVAEKLRRHNITTVQSLISADLESLSRESKLPAKALVQLTSELACALAPKAKRARVLVDESREQDVVLSTGLPALDEFLGGGLATGEVCELIGGPGSGKTQLCLAMCAHQAATGGATAVYIDTSHSFRAGRALQLLRAFSCPPGPSCDDEERLGQAIRVSVAPSVTDVCSVLESLLATLRARDRPAAEPWCRRLRLLILDSAFGALASDHVGLSLSAAGLQLARMQRLLRELASSCRLAVIVTNICQQSISTGSDSAAVKAGLGAAWQHTAHLRLLLCKSERACSRAGGGGVSARRGTASSTSELRLVSLLKRPHDVRKFNPRNALAVPFTISAEAVA